MGVLQRFESRLENIVQGAFAKAFRSEVQPVEIAAAIQRELDNNAQIVSRARSLVPNHFIVDLGSHDYGRLADYLGTLSSELIGLARDHAELQNYAFTGPVRVEFEQHDDLGTGQFRMRSSVRAGVDRGATYTPTETVETHAAAYLVVNGTRHPVISPGIVLGRGSECDIRIDDPGVSRRHVQVRVNEPGHGLVAQDLGSTNGTEIDGVRTKQAPVSDGSRIKIGSTVIDVQQQTVRR